MAYCMRLDSSRLRLDGGQGWPRSQSSLLVPLPVFLPKSTSPAAEPLVKSPLKHRHCFTTDQSQLWTFLASSTYCQRYGRDADAATTYRYSSVSPSRCEVHLGQTVAVGCSMSLQ